MGGGNGSNSLTVTTRFSATRRDQDQVLDQCHATIMTDCYLVLLRTPNFTR